MSLWQASLKIMKYWRYENPLFLLKKFNKLKFGKVTWENAMRKSMSINALSCAQDQHLSFTETLGAMWEMLIYWTLLHAIVEFITGFPSCTEAQEKHHIVPLCRTVGKANNCTYFLLLQNLQIESCEVCEKERRSSHLKGVLKMKN